MNTEKKISKIKIIDTGLKGLAVSYVLPQEKDGMMWHNEHVEKRKHPIHKKLTEHLEELTNFLLDCCGYYNGSISVNEKDYLISETRVTQVQVSGQDGFKITGEMRVQGDKYIKIETPLVESADGYEDFSPAFLVINKILDETHEYMAGKVKFDHGQFLMNFAEKKHDEVMIQEFAHMSNEEKRDRCTEILEKMGAIVIINDDLDVSDVQLEIVPVDQPAEQVELAEPVVTEVEPIKQDPVIIMPPPEMITIEPEKKDAQVFTMPAF